MMVLPLGSISCTHHQPNLIPCSFKVPLNYNDGIPIPESTREGLLDGIYESFGGYTITGTETGAYRRSDTGQKQVEPMLNVVVVVEGRSGVDQLRRQVRQIGAELGQESMYFQISNRDSVEFVESSHLEPMRD
jgi:hypothetical protein